MSRNIHGEKILILDFGAQYTQLIARRVREIGVYCEIHPHDMAAERLQDFDPQGVILSGGPESATGDHRLRAPGGLFALGGPLLGVWFGMATLGGEVGGCVGGFWHFGWLGGGGFF